MRPMLALALVMLGCSAPYEVRLSDGRSASCGAISFFGWADPPLVPGTRLVDAREGQRLVIFNESGFEAIIDVGDPCAVLVREGEGARAPTSLDLAMLARVFPAWRLAPSPFPAHYAEERRLERRFPSHIRAYFHDLDPAAAVRFALGESPAGWFALGGRVHALERVAMIADGPDLSRILDATMALEGDDRTAVLRSLIARRDLTAATLVRIAKSGGAVAAARHPNADEEVCLAAVAEIAKELLSSRRRAGLEAVLESPGVTDRVRKAVLDVPLAYPEDRESVRKKAATSR